MLKIATVISKCYDYFEVLVIRRKLENIKGELKNVKSENSKWKKYISMCNASRESDKSKYDII